MSNRYQVTWFGQISSKVVRTLEEAEKLEAKTLADYKKSFEAGWVNRFDPSAVQIQSTSKAVGKW